MHIRRMISSRIAKRSAACGREDYAPAQTHKTTDAHTTDSRRQAAGGILYGRRDGMLTESWRHGMAAVTLELPQCFEAVWVEVLMSNHTSKPHDLGTPTHAVSKRVHHTSKPHDLGTPTHAVSKRVHHTSKPHDLGTPTHAVSKRVHHTSTHMHHIHVAVRT
jgi:hypothetical protein